MVEMLSAQIDGSTRTLPHAVITDPAYDGADGTGAPACAASETDADRQPGVMILQQCRPFIEGDGLHPVEHPANDAAHCQKNPDAGSFPAGHNGTDWIGTGTAGILLCHAQ